MTELDKKVNRHTKKYLWFGYGNYGGLPNMQNSVGGGYVRDPGLLDGFLKEEEPKRSTVSLFRWVIFTVIGLPTLMMLLAWVMSLIM